MSNIKIAIALLIMLITAIPYIIVMMLHALFEWIAYKILQMCLKLSLWSNQKGLAIKFIDNIERLFQIEKASDE